MIVQANIDINEVYQNMSPWDKESFLREHLSDVSFDDLWDAIPTERMPDVREALDIVASEGYDTGIKGVTFEASVRQNRYTKAFILGIDVAGEDIQRLGKEFGKGEYIVEIRKKR